METKAIEIFKFQNTDVRIFINEKNEPEFNANDVAKILGYINPHDAIEKHCRKDGVAKREVIDNLGRKQMANYLNEGNLYRLIARSNKPEAEPFESWIFDEVLPAIRKHGAYIAPVEKQMSTLDFLEMQVKLLREQETKVKQLESKVTEIDARTQTRPDYFTIMGYAVLHEIQIGLQMAAKIGAKASRICKNKGIETESMPDPRFGRVKLYPKSILDEVFNEPVSNN